MLEGLQVSLQAIAGYGQTSLLLVVAVVILHGGPANPTSNITAGTGSTISQQACQREGCIFYQSSKLYLSIRLMEFRGVLVNGTSVIMNTAMLSREYNRTGAILNETDNAINFTYSYGDQKKFFNISMIFWMDANRHNWSLVMVTYLYSDEILSSDHYNEHGGQYEDEYYYEDVGEDSEDDGGDYKDNEEDYTYSYEGGDAENDTILTHTYPLWVGASQNTAYTCDNLAGVSNNSDSELYIYDFKMQPFYADENDPPSNVKDCTASITDKDDNTGLILGTIAGAAIVITVVIVIATYFYRRKKRGKYNLLD